MKFAALWSLAAAAVLAGLGTALGGSWMFSTQMDAFTDDSYYRWANLLMQASTPLLTGGLLTALIALVAHATVWRRRSLSSRPPAPSP